MNIPPQLQRDNFRFILVGNNKSPIEPGWTTHANYHWNDPRIRASTNAGIICGIGGLIVIDFDDAAAHERALPVLPLTFTVTTGGRGLSHLYYLVTDTPRTVRYNDANGRRLFDVQGPGTQVILPGSINLKTGRKYVISRDVPIRTTTQTELEAIHSYLFPEASTYGVQKKTQPRAHKFDFRPFDAIRELKRATDIVSIAEHYGTRVRAEKARCPFHDDQHPSLTFSKSKGVFYCHACGAKGDIIHFVERAERCTRAEAIRKLAHITNTPWPPSRDDDIITAIWGGAT